MGRAHERRVEESRGRRRLEETEDAPGPPRRVAVKSSPREAPLATCGCARGPDLQQDDAREARQELAGGRRRV